MTNGTFKLWIDSATYRTFIDSIPISRGGYTNIGQNITNIAIGDSALAKNTTGTNNTGVGYQVLARDSVGLSNTAFGYQVLKNNKNATGLNTGIGAAALTVNTTGHDNTAAGANSLLANTTGVNNTANGSSALAANTTASNNTASGYFALKANTTGTSNTSFGANSLATNTVNSFQSAFGKDALSLATGERNSAFGDVALQNTTTGVENTAMGDGAMYQNTTGRTNIRIGAEETGSLGNTTGSYNVWIGGNLVMPANNLSNYGVFGDGQGNQRILWNTTGQVGIGNRWPSASLHLAYGRAAQFGAPLNIPYTNVTTTNATQSATTVTLTFAAQEVQPFGVGDTITVAGITPSGYNGTFRVTGGSTTTVIYSTTAGLTGQTVAGTVIAGGALLTTIRNGTIERDSVDLYWTSGLGSNTTRFKLNKTLSNSATLDFGNLVAIGCEDLTITVTGAVDGDPVSLGVPNASIVANSSYSAWVSAANTVSVRFCALVSGDPASGIFKVTVIK